MATWITDIPQTLASITLSGGPDYLAGTTVLSTIAFVDTNGNPYDPATVQVSAGSRCSTPTAAVFGQTGSLVARTGVGVYTYPVNTSTATGLAERWTVQWAAGNTAGQTTVVESADFTVTADIFPLHNVSPVGTAYGSGAYGQGPYGGGMTPATHTSYGADAYGSGPYGN